MANFSKCLQFHLNFFLTTSFDFFEIFNGLSYNSGLIQLWGLQLDFRASASKRLREIDGLVVVEDK